MATFKDRITQLWEEAKDKDYTISQESFAKRFGATRNQFRGWLIGAGEPDSEMLKIIAKKSNVTVDWLVGASNDIGSLPATMKEEFAFLAKLNPGEARKLRKVAEILYPHYFILTA